MYKLNHDFCLLKLFRSGYCVVRNEMHVGNSGRCIIPHNGSSSSRSLLENRSCTQSVQRKIQRRCTRPFSPIVRLCRPGGGSRNFAALKLRYDRSEHVQPRKKAGCKFIRIALYVFLHFQERVKFLGIYAIMQILEIKSAQFMIFLRDKIPLDFNKHLKTCNQLSAEIIIIIKI